ncbi:hypothetical protein Y1Q_0002839 [Alligator mississippiensis]|uniref:Uncharacterized protein n=1 Tax=Alligator mississippiensis TaxID=8496 RepID=A0A151P0Q3_ALLMI|nr:hypothetical protein Y1Q_0002839 [Alligator mississippiensis]
MLGPQLCRSGLPIQKYFSDSISDCPFGFFTSFLLTSVCSKWSSSSSRNFNYRATDRLTYKRVKQLKNPGVLAYGLIC